MTREIFGPVLHVATFKANDLDTVIDAINATGYGLTFGLHTRIDDRVQTIVERIEAGNIYVNRDQIGAVVGSQPFGGEGLSGTGPKAGGPILPAPLHGPKPAPIAEAWTTDADIAALTKTLKAKSHAMPNAPTDLPGPTGESNRHSTRARGPILCMGPSEAATKAQVAAVTALGGTPVGINGKIDPSALATLPNLAGVIWWGDTDTGRAIETGFVGPYRPDHSSDHQATQMRPTYCMNATSASTQQRQAATPRSWPKSARPRQTKVGAQPTLTPAAQSQTFAPCYQSATTTRPSARHTLPMALMALNIAVFLYGYAFITSDQALNQFYYDYAMIPARISQGENYRSLMHLNFHARWFNAPCR